MLPRSFSLRWETFRLLAREKNRPQARMARVRPAGSNDAQARTARGKEVFFRCCLDLSPRAGRRSVSLRGRRIARKRGWNAGGNNAQARTARGKEVFFLLLLFFFLLFFFFFFPFSPSIDHRRSKLIANDRFWRYYPIAGGPRTGNLADRYVPLVPGSTDQNCKP
ncbi:hypothetical protein BHM03_00046026 [Ensete ventricosum]|nr:hypothetical protein BHM03_00046026 [Ensete ventricosum]